MNHGQEHARFASRFLSRRSLLRIGGLGCLGIPFAGPLRAEARAAVPNRGQSLYPQRDSPLFGTAARVQSCILLFYYGGPSHLDT